MKNFGLRFFEVQPLRVPKRIRPATMEKCAPSRFHFRHHIGVRSGRAIGDLNLLSVNLMALEIGEDVFAQRILAHQPRATERNLRAQLGEIHNQIVGRPARALALAQNVGQRFPLRKHIHHLHLIHDPVPRR